MRISELAELAGLTVRTIRYYHQIGVLAEPPRRSNGYREYSADHLVALLRIAQLTGSGLTLAQAGDVARGSDPSSAEEALDAVDRSLEARIAVLAGQRERLARARAGGHVGLSRAAAALSLHPVDVPIAIAIAHLYRDHPQIDVLAAALRDPERRAGFRRLQERFEALDGTTTDEELAELLAAARSHVAGIGDGLPALTDGQLQVILDLADHDLTERQRDFLRRSIAPED